MTGSGSQSHTHQPEMGSSSTMGETHLSLLKDLAMKKQRIKKSSFSKWQFPFCKLTENLLHCQQEKKIHSRKLVILGRLKEKELFSNIRIKMYA